METNARPITNEQLLLVNILNTMYNDNIRQINQYNNRINFLMEDNSRIRETLTQILHSSGFVSSPTINSNAFLTSPQYVIDVNIPLTRQPARNRSNRRANTFAELLQGFLEPVEVRPTETQIEAATRRVRYADIARPLNTQCPISMEAFSDEDIVTVIRPCGHIFQTGSLHNWFETNTRCPVCRYDIRDYNLSVRSFYDPSSNNISLRSLIDTSLNNVTLGTLFDSSFNDSPLNSLLDISFNNVLADGSGNALSFSASADMLWNLLHSTPHTQRG